MNDRQDPQGQIYGYDEYGRPLYGAPGPPGGYDYGTGEQATGYQDYDYGGQDTGQQQATPAYGAYDYGTGTGATSTDYPADYPAGYTADAANGYGTGYASGYGYDYGTGEQPPVASEPRDTALDAAPGAAWEEQSPGVPGQRQPSGQEGTEAGQGAQGGQEGYDTEQFSFVDEPTDNSQDVIDWMKFTESRTERREEAKRRGRSRRRFVVIGVVVAVLAATALLWATGSLPGVSGPGEDDSSSGAQTRDVIVVHLRETGGDLTATALLVANETTGEGTTLLLPNDLSVSLTSGTTTLGEAVGDSSAGDVRDALGSLLGADIEGTWRLDTPYLELLVNTVGGITVDTNAEVTAGEGDDKETVPQGKNTDLDGQAAVAYATHLGDGEEQTAQLERFGQVMQAVLAQMPTGTDSATEVVRALAQVPDPSLSEEELGASLATLAGYQQATSYETTLLPVQDDGSLSDETADGVVKDVLGGTVENSDSDSDSGSDSGGATSTEIAIRNASGAEDAAEDARIALVNGGFSVSGSSSVDDTEATSAVVYTSADDKETAVEAAKTLGLSEDVVSKGESSGNADVTITLGEDYPE